MNNNGSTGGERTGREIGEVQHEQEVEGDGEEA